ncbi:unnamed protein product [Protopolystoma xenopodis]|uniref:Uncharacterized protein n=1 Tax=Protopolystoma xenopodis TaxID=117903 RepID=A0A3S5ATW4_9PLAT|nr:unnamed protein product [Protopolystoma xenopodis]
MLDLLRCLACTSVVSHLLFIGPSTPTTDNTTSLPNAAPPFTNLLRLSLRQTDLPSTNCLLVLRLIANGLATLCADSLATETNDDNRITDLSTGLTYLIECANEVAQLVTDPTRLQLELKKQHQVN